nr:protein HEATR9 isoform X2 [Pelodiscus sinensis]|eukprot:XP_025041454.1 protein HEATR9 isoform X2 [Pelodiscus sinensis]
MGDIKMPLKRIQGSGSLATVPGSTMPEAKKKTAGKKELELRLPQPSCHQIPREVFPLLPSVWRKSTLQHGIDQLWVVEQPGLACQRQLSAYQIKAKRKKSMADRNKSDFLLSKFLKSIHSLFPAKIRWKDDDPEVKILKMQRIKELTESLASSVEQEQIYAAQALGCLGVTDELVLTALRNAVCRSLPVRCEVSRTLVLLGCLDAAVVRELLRQLKKGSPAQREDALAALEVALHRRAMAPESQSVGGSQARLVRALEQLAASQDPTDDSVLSAATCLVFLDASSPTAREVLLKCLAQQDMKKKMHVRILPEHCALNILVKHMVVVNADIIQALIDQLRHSPVYKHRADAANLLSSMGLERIQQEGLEKEVFQLLVEKLHREPFLVVRQTVAMASGALQMKEQIWDLVEKQLKEKSEISRKQAAASLGVLGLRNKHMFFSLLETLELDSSPAVRIQAIRAFCTLGMNNTYVLKTLRLKEQTDEAIARWLEDLERLGEKFLLSHIFDSFVQSSMKRSGLLFGVS